MAIIADQNQGCGCGQGTQTGEEGVIFNNNILVPKKYVYIDWSLNISPETQIRNKLNNLSSWDVTGNDLYLIYNYKNQTMVQQENFNPEIHTWIFRRGKGSYGTNGDDAVENNSQLYPLAPTRGNYENVSYDLGNIATEEIDAFLNSGNITYSINPSVWNIFSCVQNGIGKKFLYIGDLNFIGDSDQSEVDPVNIEDFLEISAEPVYPPTESNEPGYFGSHKNLIFEFSITGVDLSNETENFIVIRNEDNDEYHFAVRQDFVRNFENGSVKFEAYIDVRFDFTVPDDIIDGYNIFDLGEIYSGHNFGGQDLQGFFVWFADGQGDATVNLSELEVNSGGNKNNFNLEGNNVILVNTTTEAIFTGFTDDNIKELIIANRGSQALALMNENTSSLAANRLKLPIEKINLPKNAVVRLYLSEIENRWKLADTLGIPYHFAFPGLSEDKVITVGENGELKSNDAIDLFIKNDIRTTLFRTDSELNSLYGSAIKGVQILCTVTRQICEKLDNQTNGKWHKTFVDRYDSGILACNLVDGITTGSITARVLGEHLIIRGSFEVNAGVNDSNSLKVFEFPTEVSSVVANRNVLVAKEATSNDSYTVTWGQQSNAVYAKVIAGETYQCYFQTLLKDVL